MSKISSYGIVSPPVAGDLVIGTNTNDSNKTKNFRVQDIAALAATPTLSSVLTAGNTATNNISLIGNLSITGASSFNGNNTFGPNGTSDFNHSVAFDAITLGSTVQDGAGSVGTAGQVLSSTGTGVAWVNDSAPIPTLSSVLTAGNTATNNLILTGDLTITGVSVFNGNNQFGPNGTSDFGHLVEFDNINLEGTVRDGAASVGTAGQVLSSTGTGVAWVNDSAPIPTLEQVLTAGNTASNDISLVGSLSVTINTNLSLNYALADNLSSVGTVGQVLSSIGSTGVKWIDIEENNVLSSFTISDQEVGAAFSKNQVNFGTAVTNAYFSLAADGTITAATAGTYRIYANLNSGCTVVGLADEHVDFFYSVDLNSSQINNTYQNTVFFEQQSAEPAQTLSMQFLQTLAVGDTLKIYQSASLFTASGAGTMRTGLVAKGTGTTGMSSVPSASLYISKV